jgi:DNA recombination protein RmuC
MSETAWLAFAAGLLLGGLAVLAWRARREQSLRIDAELLRARIGSEAAAGAEREQQLLRTREQLQNTFGDLARDSLQSNSEIFLRLAAERLTRQQQEAAQVLQERETAIESLVRPIRDALTKTEQQIQSIERERIDSFATIKAHIDVLATGQNALSRETRNLVSALRRPNVRGQWGEITLRRLVELAGMSSHVDFSEQLHLNIDGGAIRPDMIVHLPAQRDIIIDVKTPLDAYLSAVEAQDDEQRGTQLRRHAQIVGARVRELSSKQYWSQFADSADFVVLFLPGDQFLSAALQENPGLMDEALSHKVMLATPTSLVALLKVISSGWRQTALAENAAEIRLLGEEIYKRLAVFGEHLGRLGKSLGSSVDSFNRAVGSLESQVLPAARRFEQLGLRVNRDIEAIPPIDTLARTPREAALERDDFPDDPKDA